jgi:GxxExxY protein
MTDAAAYNELSRRVIGAAIEVHRHLGPGLLESVYQRALEAELTLCGIAFRTQLRLPIDYKGVRLDCTLRTDLLVENRLLVELKAVETVLPVHASQLLTYLRLLDVRLGLLINFNVPVLWRGIKRVANNL